MDAPEAEHVVFCVKLLERRGFVIRYVEAARNLVGRRRGIVLCSVLAMLSGIVGVLMLDLPRGPLAGTSMGTPDEKLEPRYPLRRLSTSAPASGAWYEVGRAELWEEVVWRTDPGDAVVEVRVGSRVLLPGEQNIINIPGPLCIRVPPGSPEPLIEFEIYAPGPRPALAHR